MQKAVDLDGVLSGAEVVDGAEVCRILSLYPEGHPRVMPSPIDHNLSFLPRIPVPPMLSEAIGYIGDGQYFAFWWDHDGGELVWADGSQTFSCRDCHPYLLFAHHETVAPHLAGFNLGFLGSQAEHALVLDRKTDSIYTGQRENVQLFLEAVTASKSPTDKKQLQQLAKQFIGRVDGLSLEDEIGHRIAGEHKLFVDLKDWLDQFSC